MGSGDMRTFISLQSTSGKLLAGCGKVGCFFC